MDENAPKYIAIYHKLKQDIISGKYPENSFLPSEEALQEQFEASRTTVRKALVLLKDDKLIEVTQGRGSRILHTGSWPTSYNISKLHGLSSISLDNKFHIEGEKQISTQASVVDIIPAETTIAEELGIQIGENVYRLQRVKMVNDTIFAFDTSYIRCSEIPELEKHSGSIVILYDFLERTYGIVVDQVRDRLSGKLSSFLESQLLNVKVGSPLLFRKRQAYSGSKIIEYCETIIKSDLYEMVIVADRYGRQSPLKTEEESAGEKTADVFDLSVNI